jgi:hypothetical protein
MSTHHLNFFKHSILSTKYFFQKFLIGPANNSTSFIIG